MSFFISALSLPLLPSLLAAVFFWRTAGNRIRIKQLSSWDCWLCPSSWCPSAKPGTHWRPTCTPVLNNIIDPEKRLKYIFLDSLYVTYIGISWRLRQITLGIHRANNDLVCDISIRSNLIKSSKTRRPNQLMFFFLFNIYCYTPYHPFAALVSCLAYFGTMLF